MNRRLFLRATALSTAALIGESRVFAQNIPSERVRIALMGCHAKGRGFQLMKALLNVPGVEVATLCDVDARAMEAASAEIQRCTQRVPRQEKDLRKVLEDKEVDGVICAAPDHWHAPAALLTMKAGKAIYVEKPVSHNPYEGELLVEAAAKYGAIFQMGNQRRRRALGIECEIPDACD